MVNVYKEIDNKLIELNYNDEHLINADSIEEKTWIHIEKPSNEMLVGLSKITNIPMTLLISALDEEESAHVDQEDNSFLIVLDVPFIDENDNITTKPFVIAYNDNYFITVSNYNKTLKDTILNKVKIVEPQKQIRMTLNFIYYLSKEFISILKIIDNKTKSIEKELYSSLKNEELFKMLAVNKTFVYISNALNADKGVLSKLLKSSRFMRYEQDMDLMEDAQIELEQAIEMCTIYRDISASTMDAFSSVIGNNLNILMKRLSIITIVLSLPTLIASIWGMNFVDLPLEKTPYGFYIVLCIALIFTIVGAIFVLFVSKNKKPKK